MNRRNFITKTGLATAGAMTPRSIHAAEKYPALAEHRIAKLETIKLNYKFVRHVGKNAIRPNHGQDKSFFATRIHTDLGAVGWGGGRFSEKPKDAFVGRKVLGMIDPDTGILPGVPGSLDVALHDLAGVILGKPVYQLLGGNGPKTNSVYSGMIYFDELEPEDKPAGMARVIENCRWDLDYGYRQLKVKIGRGNKWYAHDEGLKMDIEVVNTIYDTFKDRGVEILVDANDGYTLQDCKDFLSGIKGVPLYWFEEPFHEDKKKSKVLRDWMHANGFEKTLFADGEYEPDIEYCLQMAEEGTLDVLLSDSVSFGFTPWRRTIPKLAKFNKAASPHAWGVRSKTNYAAHLSAGLGHCCTIEGVTCVSDEIDFGNYPLVDGKITVSEAPGFGMKLLV